MRKNLAIIMAGGTAGHIMPGLAIADILLERGWEIIWLGNNNRMESTIVTSKGIPFKSINFYGLPNKKIFSLINFSYSLFASIIKVWKIFSRSRPSLVIGMGGYVTIPGGVVSIFSRVPLILHEQNSVMGRANLFLYRFSSHLLCGYPLDGYDKAIFVGNPLRKEFSNINASCYINKERDCSKLNLLILGGSLGSGDINNILSETFSLFSSEEMPFITHQCGDKNLKQLKEKYASYKIQANCIGFIDNMVKYLSKADLVICRSGAMTISEIIAVGVASLLIPFPRAINNHQWKNAEFLYKNEAAWLVKQEDLKTEWLASWLKNIDRYELKRRAMNAHNLYKSDVNNKIAEICDKFKRI